MTSPFLNIATGLLRGSQRRRRDDLEDSRYEQERNDRIQKQDAERKYQQERDAAAQSRQAMLDDERVQDRMRAGYEAGYVPQDQLQAQGRQVEQAAAQPTVVPDFTGVTAALRGAGMAAQQAKPVYSVGGTPLVKGAMSVREQEAAAAQRNRDADQREARDYRKQDQEFQATEAEKSRQNQVRITGMGLAARALQGERAPRPAEASAVDRVAAGFARRMEESEALLSEFDKQGVTPTRPFLANASKALLPDAFGGEASANMLTPEPTQRYLAAATNWIRANLRKESGAAIGADEMADEMRNYFPQKGDTPATKADKAERRRVAIQSMQQNAGNAYTPYVPSQSGTPLGVGGNPLARPAARPPLGSFQK